MLKKPSKRINYKKRLWKVFSEYIRRRDQGKCFTCSTVQEWKDTDAGHYIPAGQSNPALYFSEKNVNCQCTSCNRYKHGNLTVYAVRLQDKHGVGVLQELDTLKHLHVKWNSWTYKIKTDEYKQKIAELKGQ
jgi:hypothetical protein